MSGGAKAPHVPTPAEQANAVKILMNQTDKRAKKQQQESDNAQKLYNARTGYSKLDEWDAMLRSAQANALPGIQTAARNQGIDLTPYSNDINDIIAQSVAKLQSSRPNVQRVDLNTTIGQINPKAKKGKRDKNYYENYAYNLPDVPLDQITNLQNPNAALSADVLLPQILNTINAKERANLRNIAQPVAGNNAGNSIGLPAQLDTLFAPTTDDALIKSILDKNYQDALGGVNTKLREGYLNDIGYSRALEELSNQRKGAEAKLQQTGSDLLTTKKSSLLDEWNNVLQGISNYSVGDAKPDILGQANQIKSKATDYLGQLEGNFRNAIGTSPLFDTTSAFSKGGIEQGTVNPARNPQYSTLNNAALGIGNNDTLIMQAVRDRRDQLNRLRTSTSPSSTF